MKPRAALAAVAALTVAVAATFAPAFAARSSYVVDDAHILSQNTITQLNQQIGDFNAQTGKYENLVHAGIIDPTKVVRAALQNAASVASLLLTTEAVVSQIAS